MILMTLSSFFEAWQKSDEFSEGLPLFEQHSFTTVNTLSLIEYVKKTIQILEQ